MLASFKDILFTMSRKLSLVDLRCLSILSRFLNPYFEMCHKLYFAVSCYSILDYKKFLLSMNPTILLPLCRFVDGTIVYFQGPLQCCFRVMLVRIARRSTGTAYISNVFTFQDEQTNNPILNFKHRAQIFQIFKKVGVKLYQIFP